MAFYCNVLRFKAPSIGILSSGVDGGNEVIPTTAPPNNINIQDVLDLQDQYAQTITNNGKNIVSIPSTMFTTANVNGIPSWTLFTIDTTSIINTYGTNKIMDFSFIKNNDLGSDNAYVRNVVLELTTTSGIETVVFDYSNSGYNSSCHIYTHPLSSSGQEVHTYQYIPEISSTILSSNIKFELADDWICQECCGNDESGTSVDITLAFEILP